MNRLFLPIFVALIVSLTGCTNPAIGSSPGSLNLTFTDGVSRTLVPETSMLPTSYLVEGVGPSGATFTQTVMRSNTVVSGLSLGLWNISVSAFNSAGVGIGSGDGTVVVHSDQTNFLNLTIYPNDGVGSLSLAVTWPGGDVEVPRVVATLLPVSGSARDWEFSGTASSASDNVSDLATGYYTLTLKLFDYSTLVAGAVEVVRIVKDQTTTGTYTFNNVNKATASLSVNIGADMLDPLDVSITGGTNSKPADETFYLTADVHAPDERPINESYVWYVNGDAQNTGKNFSFDDNWPTGFYRVDVTAFSADGTRAGSTSLAVQVVAESLGAGPAVRAADAGVAHSMFVKTDGSLWAMGYNYYGQFGNGTTTDSPTPIQILASGVRSVAAGSMHTMVLMTDGSLWGAGQNSSGSLGDGSAVDRNQLVQIMPEGVQAIDAGSYHTMILKTDGSLWATGSNSSGQLGDGTTTDRFAPVEILAGGVRAVSAGEAHTVFLKTDGSLWAMGANIDGRLGDGTTTDRLTPVEVVTGGVQAISAGDDHTVYVKTDGSLWGFGGNALGQLGDGTSIDSLAPIEILSSGVQAVSAGASDTKIVMTDGSLWATGWNIVGQLGDGSTINQHLPVKIIGNGVQTVVSWSHTMVTRTGGSLWTFGSNGFGQLGDGTTSTRDRPVKILSATH